MLSSLGTKLPPPMCLSHTLQRKHLSCHSLLWNPRRFIPIYERGKEEWRSHEHKRRWLLHYSTYPHVHLSRISHTGIQLKKHSYSLVVQRSRSRVFLAPPPPTQMQKGLYKWGTFGAFVSKKIPEKAGKGFFIVKNKANAKRCLTCTLQAPYKQLAVN